MWELKRSTGFGRRSRFTNWESSFGLLKVDRYYNGIRAIYWSNGPVDPSRKSLIPDGGSDLAAMIDHMFDEEDWVTINPIVDWMIDNVPEFARFMNGETDDVASRVLEPSG